VAHRRRELEKLPVNTMLWLNFEGYAGVSFTNSEKAYS
jgi:hypothetical protein